jgi:hypothetical protein
VTNVLRADLFKDIDPERLAIANDVLSQILNRFDALR